MSRPLEWCRPHATTAARNDRQRSPTMNPSPNTPHPRRTGGLACRSLVIILGLFGPTVRGDVATPVSDRLETLPWNAVQLDGVLGDSLRVAATGRLAHPGVGEMLQPFRERKDVHEWRSEFWGKWITAAIPVWQATGDEHLGTIIHEAVAGLLKTQSEDGYIGAYADDQRLQRWDLWGRKYTLLGLLAWHEAIGDEVALTAAKRLADRVLAEVGPGQASPFTHDMWNGLASGSILEPMVLLHRRTGYPRYLEFAQYLVKSWSNPDGPDLLTKVQNRTPVFEMFQRPDPNVSGYAGHGKAKAYEMMSNFEGLIELYRVTGDSRFESAAEWAYDNIKDTEITIVGSGSDWERWCNGTQRQTVPWTKGIETCVTVTWMKYSAQLLRLTGDAAYADEIERAAYNSLLGAQAGDGQWWCHHMPLFGVKERAPGQCGLNQNCCVANGPRGLIVLPQIAVMNRAQGPVVNLYGAMRAQVSLQTGGNVSLVQATEYPADGDVQLTVSPDAPREFTLALRIPAWSAQTRVTVNDEDISGAEAGRYLELKRTWRAGDVVRLRFDFSPRVVSAPGDDSHVAVLRGPLVLARDERLSPGQVDQPVALQPNQAITLRRMTSDLPEIAEIYQVAGTDLKLCDFASAGNTWAADSRYRVWMPRQQ